MERLAANTMAGLSFTMLMLGTAAALATILGAVLQGGRVALPSR